MSGEVTAADVERTRSILQAQEAWNQVIGEAYRARCEAGVFASWVEGHEWLRGLPRMPLPPLELLAFEVSEQRVVAGARRRGSLAGGPRRRRRKAPPVIAPDRQLEIAIAALGAIEEREARDAVGAVRKGQAA